MCMCACMRVSDSVGESTGMRREERGRERRVIKVFQR